MQTPTPQQVVEGLVARFDPQKAGTLKANVVLELSGETWTLVIANGTCRAQAGAVDPNLTLRLSVADFMAMASGQLDAATALMTGRLKVTGDLGLAQRFQSLFRP